jgi:hypothetical protein
LRTRWQKSERPKKSCKRNWRGLLQLQLLLLLLLQRARAKVKIEAKVRVKVEAEVKARAEAEVGLEEKINIRVLADPENAGP